MQFKNLLSKTLLVAGLLWGGVNYAWAADSFLPTMTGMVGTATNDGNFKYATKKVNIAAGETYVYTLTNLNDGNNDYYWRNWVVEGNLGTKYFDCEARGNQWQAGDGPVPSYTPVMAYTDVENFQTAYNGATVTITISRNAAGNQFTVTHTSNVLGTTDGNTDKYYGGTWTVAVGAEENWDIYITEEYSHFVVTSVTYTDAESNVTNYNPVYQRGYTTAWSSENDIKAGEWVASKGSASIDADRGLKVAQQRGSALASKSISVTENAILTIDAEWDTGYANGNDNENNAITIGNNIEVRAYTYKQKGYVYINGAEYATISNACGKNNGNRTDDLWTIHIVVNTASNTITAFTISGRDGTDKASYTLDGTISLNPSTTYNSISLAHNRTASNNAAEATYLKSILISEVEQEVSNVDYTVKFHDTLGNTLKDDVIYTNGAVVGALYTASTTDMTTFYNAGSTKKYVYKSGQNTSTTATATASENVITLVFDTYEKFTYSLKYKLGAADAVEQATADIWEDETATIYYPVCRQDDGDNYYVVAKNESEPYFGKVMTSSNNDITINYTLDEDIVYYKESENMAGSRYNYVQVAAKTSNGSSYCSAASNGSYIATDWSVAAGNYNIEVAISGRKASTATPKLMTSAEDASPVTLANVTVADGGLNTKTYYNQMIVTGQNIYIFNDNGNNASLWALDYVILRTAPTTVTTTVSDAGFATYVNNNYDLDFSSTSIEAYKVKVSTKGTATLTKVNQVPAGTPVLLYKEGGATEAIPVMTGAAAVSDNDLVAGTGAAVATSQTIDEVAYTNMILNNGTSGIGFYFANGQTVAANRAYLHFASEYAPEASSARPMNLVFEDMTGINSVKGEEFMVNGSETYNLQGQRVAQPTKGLYIINGKKVMVK